MKKRVLALGLCLALLCGLAVPALAADFWPARSDNAGDQNYGRWASPVRSYLAPAEDGGVIRVEALAESVVVENYDKEFNLTDSRTLPMELPLFGGFFAGEEGYYFVFGQTNREEDDAKEVIRVVKYGMDWLRQGAASLSDCNTTVPFDAGSLRMAEFDGMLYVRTCHEMYAIDGVNHQANLTFALRESTMEITDQFSKVMNIDYGYVSHSFNQFITVSGGVLAAVDHGDAHPRALTLITYAAPAGGDKLSGSGCGSVDLMAFPGAVGDNTTGATVGGFAANESAYLVAGSAVQLDGDYAQRATRNAFVCRVTPAGRVDSGSTVRTDWLTNYVEGSAYSASTPHLTALGDGTYLMLWQRLELNAGGSSYAPGPVLEAVHLDARGRTLGETVELEGVLSDCAPLVVDGRAVWYTTERGVPRFYLLDPETMTLENRSSVRGEMENFTRTGSYRSGLFSDVAPGAWYEGSVQAAYELGLMQGSGGRFSPDDRLTVGEAVALADRLHSIYLDDGARFAQTGGPWYEPYVDYAKAEGILKGDDWQYTAQCSRQIFASILAAALPAQELPGLRQSADVQDGGDFANDRYRSAAGLLYAAGVVNGVPGPDGAVRFNPRSPVSRAEAAAFISRMADPSLRQG